MIRNSPQAWTPVQRARPFQAQRLSQGLTQPHDIPCLYGKLPAGWKGRLPSRRGKWYKTRLKRLAGPAHEKLGCQDKGVGDGEP